MKWEDEAWCAAFYATAEKMTEDEGFEFIQSLPEEIGIMDENLVIALVKTYPNLIQRLKG